MSARGRFIPPSAAAPTAAAKRAAPEAANPDGCPTCGAMCLTREVKKEGANKGRSFWVCPNGTQGNECDGFLGFTDEGGPRKSTPKSSGASSAAVLEELRVLHSKVDALLALHRPQ